MAGFVLSWCSYDIGTNGATFLFPVCSLFPGSEGMLSIFIPCNIAAAKKRLHIGEWELSV